MASSPTRRAALAALLLLAGTHGASVGAAPTKAPTGAISLDAASTEVDYRTNKVIFRDVIISQGDIKVEAQRAEASGLDFENSHWTFTGNVRINVEQRGNLQSDRAIVEFRNNQVSRALIVGEPAVFEQKREGTDQTARGRAGQIEYAVGAGTVRLSGNAWLSDGQKEISGPLVVYNIRQENVQASTAAGGNERVRITILPKSSSEKRDPPK